MPLYDNFQQLYFNFLIIVFNCFCRTQMINQVHWKAEEDQFVQTFRQTNNQISWEQISAKMTEQLNLPKKTGKQCQQRYQQMYGSDAITKIDWTEKEEEILIQKHREIGNKWASISQFLNGKNDNCVKNHFYSRLRKMIRKLNRIVQIYFKKTFRTIPNTTIYKLVEASQERFKDKPICVYEVSMVCQDAISKMLKISVKQELKSQEPQKIQKDDLEQYKELIEEINRANKNYKKKSKKIKNSTIKAPVRRVKGSKQKKSQYQIQEDYRADQSEIESESEYEKNEKSEKFETFVQPIHRFVMEAQQFDQNPQDPSIVMNAKKVQIKEGDEMQELLKNIGLLHQGKQEKKFKDKVSQKGNHSIKSFSDFQNPSQDLSYFNDTNNCWKNQAAMFSKLNKNLFGDNSSEVEGL